MITHLKIMFWILSLSLVHFSLSHMSELFLVLKLVPVVSASGCSVGRLNQKAGGGHRWEERAEAEESEVEEVSLLFQELLFVPEGRGEPQDEAEGRGCADGRVWAGEAMVLESLR